MKWCAIVLLSIAMCVAYGIAHDMVTARICVEYFTIGHAPIFGTEDPTTLALCWGVIATWWVGALLGIPLACAARIGSWPKREPLSLLRPMLVLMLCSYVVAIVAGLCGWLAATNGWVFLIGSIAERVPEEKHVPFLIDLWAHTGSYAAGFIGGMVVIGTVIRQRWKESRDN